MMEREEILSKIQHCQPELKKLGVKRLAIFGSVGRGEAHPGSDLDVLVEFEGGATFDGFMDTRFLLEDTLEMPVDLVTPQALRPRIRSYIERDLIYILNGASAAQPTSPQFHRIEPESISI
jgi:uncharacterized protein